MMSRVLFSVVSVLLLSLASTSYGLVLGDFEGTMDGWGETSEKNATFALSTVGAVTGSQSLAVKLTGGYWSLQYNAPSVPVIVPGTKLEFEVTMVQSEWTNNNWTKVADKIALNGGASGWKEYIPTAVDTATGQAAALDWGPWNPTVTRTVSVDVSDYDTTGATEFQIVIALQQNPNEGSGFFYIDNVQLVEPAKKIVWVSFHGADDAPSADAVANGFSAAPDKGYTDLLAANGYDVVRFVSTKTPDVNVLNAADLVIVSRSVDSSHYGSDAATIWNTKVTAPMIITGGYTLRKSRMGFTTGNTIPDTTGDIKLTVSDLNHPIFAGIAMTNGTMDTPFAGVVAYPTDGTIARGISVNTDAPNAAGTVLATIAAPADPNDPNDPNDTYDPITGPAGGMIIAEWPARVTTLTHDGGAGTDVLAGPRLVFLTGSREANGKKSATAGMFDLTEDGARMFLNAVAYMMTPKPVAIPVVNASFELPGTAKIKGWNGEGIAGTPAVDIPGWATDAGVAVADSGVESDTRYPATDGKWTAFMKGADPSIWQLTNFVIQADDVFVLKVDARITWNAKTLKMSLYCDAGGVRVPIASQDVALTNAMQTFTLEFAAKDMGAVVGMKIGIEFDNVTADGNSWAGLDNVSLTLK